MTARNAEKSPLNASLQKSLDFRRGCALILASFPLPTILNIPSQNCEIRAVHSDDLKALEAIEQRCFKGDRITPRQWRYMLTRSHADIMVCEDSIGLAGYVLVLYNRATSVARLYSIAVESRTRGSGIARRLVQAAESAAWKRGRAYMRLEVRRDNSASLGLFEGMGYRRFGVLDDYYEDHMQAIRFEKILHPDLKPELALMPYYEQTLEFTCGPSALMMAMKALRPETTLDRTLELRLWREATTIFMTSGHGGCGPFGLALAAFNRGFQVEIYVNDESVPMLDTVRSEEKKEVMRLVHAEMLAEIEASGVAVHYKNLPLDDMQQRFREGAIPLVLISSWRIYAKMSPHWVVVSGYDEHFVYVNDPYVDHDEGECVTDSINIAIPRSEFTRMARYGRAGLQAVVLVSAAETGANRD